MGFALTGFLTAPLGYRGYTRLAGIIGRMVKPNAMAVVDIAPGCHFRFRLNDAYWNTLLCPIFKYEPEIEYMLKRLAAKTPVAFFDCGANLGYWSVRASDPALGIKHIQTVEMQQSLLPYLTENAKLNGNRFTIINKAMHEQDGLTVKIANPEAHPAAAHAELATEGGITTVSLKTLVESTVQGGNELPVIKLDIEGLEDETVASWPGLFDRPAVVIFEEHGQDSASPLARRLLADPRVAIIFLSDAGHATSITTTQQIDALKRNPHKGYNLAAVSGQGVAEWLEQT